MIISIIKWRRGLRFYIHIVGIPIGAIVIINSREMSIIIIIKKTRDCFYNFLKDRLMLSKSWLWLPEREQFWSWRGHWVAGRFRSVTQTATGYYWLWFTSQMIKRFLFCTIHDEQRDGIVGIMRRGVFRVRNSRAAVPYGSHCGRCLSGVERVEWEP